MKVSPKVIESAVINQKEKPTSVREKNEGRRKTFFIRRLVRLLLDVSFGFSLDVSFLESLRHVIRTILYNNF